MRIHTDNLGHAAIRHAADYAGVSVELLEARGSRKRDHAFEVALSGSSPYNGGSSKVEWPYKAATWDEWGQFIDYLFTLEPDAIIGHYDGDADFMIKTADEVYRVQTYHGDGHYRKTHTGPWLARLR